MSRHNSSASIQRGTSAMAAAPSAGACDTACCCVHASSMFKDTSNRPAASQATQRFVMK